MSELSSMSSIEQEPRLFRGFTERSDNMMFEQLIHCLESLEEKVSVMDETLDLLLQNSSGETM